MKLNSEQVCDASRSSQTFQWTNRLNFLRIACVCACVRACSVRIAGGGGALPPPPPPSSPPPPSLGKKFAPGGVEFQPPHLSFSEVGMLLDSHFLPMQFLKYLQCDDLNVTTILIHI